MMRRWFDLALLALIVLVSAVALYMAVRQPAAERYAVGVPGDGFVAINFYGPERDGATSFRWSGRGSALLLDGSFDGPRQLSMRLQGNSFAPPAAGPPLRLTRDGASVAELSVRGGWRVYHVLLPPDAVADQPGQEPLLLVGPTYRPGEGDPRDLGVALSWFSSAPLAADPGPAPLARTLLLGWLLALLGVGLWLVDAASAPHAPRWRTARVAGLLAAAGAGLAVCTWRWASITAWAVPVEPRGLAITSGALAAIGLLARYLPDQETRRPGDQETRKGISPSPRLPGSRSPRLLVSLFALLANLLLLPGLAPELRGIAAVIILLTPGALAALTIFADERDPLERAFLAICGGATVFALMVFGLEALPGPLPWWLLLGLADGLTIVLLVWGWRGASDLSAATSPLTGRANDDVSAATSPLALRAKRSPGDAKMKGDGASECFAPAGATYTIGPLVMIMLLAGALRLWGLGNSEFQGDEARAILLANGIRNGYDGLLLTHTKGPVEALLPAGPLVLTGQMPELSARLPFALASMGLVLGAYLLARRLFAGEGRLATWAGLLAALLIATDGLLIGFARIVQYQSVVMLSMAGGLWCCWRFYEGAARPTRYLVCAAAIVAVGLLAHYDAGMAAPTLAWLVLVGGWRRGWRGLSWPRGLWAPLLTGGLLLASFYLPFVLNERFTRTASYLAGRARDGNVDGLLFNNLPQYYKVLTFYNTTFQVQAAWAALLAGLTAWLLRMQNARRSTFSTLNSQFSILRLALAILLLATAGLTAYAPAVLWLPGQVNAALVGFGLPLAGLIVLPGISSGLRAALIWFAVPFVAEAFLIAEPRTHFYTMHIAGAMLIGLSVARLLSWLGERQLGWLRPWLGLAGAGLLLLALPYLDLAFLRQLPEYKRSFPAARPALYRSSYGEIAPEGGFFGFPHRDGWKAVAQLYAAGELRGSYNVNQNPYLTGWYLRDALLCKSLPDYYFVAITEQQQYIPLDRSLIGEIYIGPQRVLDIYGQEAVATPQRYQLAPLAAAFDATAVPDFSLARALDELTPRNRLSLAWQNGATLRGYDLPRPRLKVGEAEVLTLHWQASRPIDRATEPVVIVRDAAGATVRELRPACADAPPSLWTTRSFAPVPFSVDAAGLVPGSYTLHAAIRHSGTLVLLEGDTTDAAFGELVVEP